MKLQFMLNAAALAGRAARTIEKRRHGGHCTVLGVLCNGCGRWVEPDEWNPTSAVCDLCTAFEASREVEIGRPVRWISTGHGRPRRKTGVR